MGLLSFIGSLLGLNSGAPQNIDVVKSPTAEGLPIIYGTRRVSPINVYKNVTRDNVPASSSFDATHTNGHDDGSEKRQDEYKWLHRIGVWGQGPINGVLDFWLDGDHYRKGRFSSKPYFRALTRFGNTGQTGFSELGPYVGGEWGAAQQGNGVAYSWMRFFNSEEDPQFNSEPRVEALVKGISVWDPEIGDRDTPGAVRYSANRALVLLDYLTADYGAGISDDKIDIESFKAAARLCDEAQTIPAVPVNDTGAPVAVVHPDTGLRVTVEDGERYPQFRPYQVDTTQPKYECHAVLDPTDGVVTNLRKLLEGVGWSLPWSGGKLKLVLEAPVDDAVGPVMVFGEDQILGGWSVTRGGREGRLNRATIEFPNANLTYENDTASWPLESDPTLVTLKAEDQGQDLHTNKTVSTITDYYMAQLYAQYLVRKSRAEPKIESLRLSPEAMLLEPGDVIGLNDYFQNFLYTGADSNHEGSGRWFIVEKVSISPTLDVTVSLLDYDSKVHDIADPDDEPLRDWSDRPDLLSKPPAVINLVATEIHETVTSGVVFSGALLTWEKQDVGTAGTLSEIRVAWREIPAVGDPGDFNQQMRLSPETTTAYVAGLYDDRTYEFKVTYTTLLGRESDPATYTLDLSAQEGAITQVISAARPPEADDGRLGWTFIDLSTGDVYVKEQGGWNKIANVAGEDGDRWHSGNGPPVNLISTDGDHYLDLDTGDVFLYSEGTWAPVTNIKGADGLNNANLYLYQRAAAEPPKPGAGVGYTFSTATFSNVPAPWQTSIQQGNDPLWVTTAVVTSNNDQVDIPAEEWTTPAVLATNTNIQVYRQATAPATVDLSDGSVWINSINGDLYILRDGSWSLGGTSTRVYAAASAPGAALEGDLWYDETNSILKRFSGSQWVDVGNSYNIQVFSQASQPSTSGLDDGSLWYETDSGTLWVLRAGSWSETANTTQTFRQNSAPSAATIGDFWYDSNDFILYRYDGSSWDVVGNFITDTAQLTDGAGLGQTSLWTGIDGKSVIAFAINERADGSSAGEDNWIRFFGVDAATGQFPDRTKPAQFFDKYGHLFEFGGTTGLGESGCYAGGDANGFHLLVLDTSGGKFSNSGTSNTRVAVVKRELADSETLVYFAGTSRWQEKEFDSDFYAIGWCERRRDKFVAAGMFDQPQNLFNLDKISIPGYRESIGDMPAAVQAGVVAINPSQPLQGQYNGGNERIRVQAFTLVQSTGVGVSYSQTDIYKNPGGYHVFVVDPDLNGEDHTFHATSSRTDIPEGAIYLGYVVVPSSSGNTTGTGSGGNGGGGTFDPNYQEP